MESIKKVLKKIYAPTEDSSTTGSSSEESILRRLKINKINKNNFFLKIKKKFNSNLDRTKKVFIL